jgi:hypothetical protein
MSKLMMIDLVPSGVLNVDRDGNAVPKSLEGGLVALDLSVRLKGTRLRTGPLMLLNEHERELLVRSNAQREQSRR